MADKKQRSQRSKFDLSDLLNVKSTEIQSLFLEYIIFLFSKGNWGLLRQTDKLIDSKVIDQEKH